MVIGIEKVAAKHYVASCHFFLFEFLSFFFFHFVLDAEFRVLITHVNFHLILIKRCLIMEILFLVIQSKEEKKHQRNQYEF